MNSNASISEVTDQDFETQVVGQDKPVLVDFWAPWCGPCRMMAPILDDVSKELEGKVSVKKLNVDDNPLAAQKLSIQSIPTLVLFSGGQPVKAWVGLQPKPALIAELNRLVA